MLPATAAVTRRPPCDRCCETQGCKDPAATRNAICGTPVIDQTRAHRTVFAAWPSAAKVDGRSSPTPRGCRGREAVGAHTVIDVTFNQVVLSQRDPSTLLGH
jgi:hypothetical protein